MKSRRPADLKTCLAVIIVVYRSYSGLCRWVGDNPDIPDSTRIIVVDNTEVGRRRQDVIASLRSAVDFEYLIPSQNLGYAGAGQYAVKELNLIGSCQYVALANSDLLFDIREFTSFLNGYGDVQELGLVAPMLTEDGEPARQLHYFDRPSSAKMKRLSLVYSTFYMGAIHRILSDVLRSYRSYCTRASVEPANEGHADIFAPHGALMIATYQFLERCGGFPVSSFLFCEEVFFGEACRQMKLKCRYLPELTYSHDNHGSMGRVPSKAIVGYLRDAHKRSSIVLSEGKGGGC